MNHRLKRVQLGVLTAMLLGPMTAFSQEDVSSIALEEIIVTATKRAESIQSIPLSVTAFTQQQLDIKGLTNIAGIQESTPNLNFSIQSAGQNVARVTLRGIGSETLVGGGDPGVALHIDGVYVGRNSASAGDVFDVERLEVLRGPQGTLYGRNATGGSVNIISKRPNEELEGSLDLTAGNFGAFRLRGIANIPLSDKLSSRITVFSDEHDGYIENLHEGGRDSNDKDKQGVRLQLLYETDSGNEFLLRGYRSETGGAGPGSRYLGTDITDVGAGGYPGRYSVGISPGPLPPAGVPLFADAYGLGTTSTGASILPLPTDLNEVRKDAQEFVDMVIQGVDFEASFNLTDNILLKSISSYQTNDNEILVDSDNSELPLQTRFRNNEAEQYSQEFNLISQTDSPFQWILGAYFYHEELIEEFEVITPVGVVPGSTGVSQFRFAGHDVDSTALFAQLSYDISDKLSVTGGIRYTEDDKDQFRTTGGQVDLTNNFRFLGGGAQGPFAPDSGSTSYSETTYRVSADYKLADESLLFASFARGYKSGGFDFNGGQIVDGGIQVPYDPEFVDAIEVGSKNKFFDGRMILNLTAFYYEYEDLQVFRLTEFGPLTDNAAESTIKGLEAEFQLVATEALRLDGSIGLLDATYDEYTIDIPPTDFSGKTLNYAPETTAHLGVEYTISLSGGELTTRVDWAYRSETFFDRANSPQDTQDSYSMFNARVRYDVEKYYVDLWGRNLGDEEYVTGQLINPPFNCGCRTVNVGSPQTYGVTVGFRF